MMNVFEENIIKDIKYILYINQLAIYEKKELSFQLCYLPSTMGSLTSLFLKESIYFFDANSLDRKHSERAHGKRKGAQMERQQFL